MQQFSKISVSENCCIGALMSAPVNMRCLRFSQTRFNFDCALSAVEVKIAQKTRSRFLYSGCIRKSAGPPLHSLPQDKSKFVLLIICFFIVLSINNIDLNRVLVCDIIGTQKTFTGNLASQEPCCLYNSKSLHKSLKRVDKGYSYIVLSWMKSI